VSTTSHPLIEPTMGRDTPQKRVERHGGVPGPAQQPMGAIEILSMLQRSAGNAATGALIRRYLARRASAPVAAEQEGERGGATAGAATGPEVGLEGGALSPDLTGRIEAKRGGGAPLAEDTRGRMEGAFSGADFAAVRVHTDAEAHDLNRSVSAVAFTTGSDIFFSQGAYSPGSGAGNHLLAHELTHVTQQRGASGGGPLTVGPAGDSHEQEAEAVASTVARSLDSGPAVSSDPGGIRRTVGTATDNPDAVMVIQQSDGRSVDVADAATDGRGGWIQRFGSDEHRDIGNAASGGATLDLDIGDAAHPFAYGELVALAGDYFESIAQIREFAQPGNPEGQAQIRWARFDKLHAGDPGAISQAVKDAVKDRYYRLAANNMSHFSAGGTARNEYEHVHQEALGLAFTSGATGNAANWSDAMATEAFSNHYLTDMFAGGHVRTPRNEMKEWYQARYPDSIDRIVSYMAIFLKDRLKGYGNIPWYWSDDAVVGKIQPKIRELGGTALASFSLGDIVALAFHNHDNAGLKVISDVDPSGNPVSGGYHWTDVGDGHLAASPITQQMVGAAVRTSLQDLTLARETGQQAAAGRCVPPEQLEAGLRTFIASVQPFAAEKYIPREDTSADNAQMDWHWGALDPVLHDAVNEAVKGEIVSVLRGQHPADMVLNWRGDPDPTGSNHLEVGRAFVELCNHLAGGGIATLEEAMHAPATLPEGTIERVDAGLPAPAPTIGPPAPTDAGAPATP